MQDNPLDAVKEPGPDITSKNAWQHIWLYPKQVFQSALSDFPGKNAYLFFALAGLSLDSLLNALSLIFYEYKMLSLLFAILGSMLFAYILSEFYAWVLSKVGLAIGGKANYQEMRTVLTWAYLPTVFAAILSLGDLAVFAENLLINDVPIESPLISIVLPISDIIQLLLGFWTFVLLAIGIKTVQGFSYFKAIVNMILPIFVIALFIFILIVILF